MLALSKPVTTLRIGELREACEIPQKQMAADLGIAAGNPSLIEHGHRGIKIPLVRRFADYLGVQPSEPVTIERESLPPRQTRVNGRTKTPAGVWKRRE